MSKVIVRQTGSLIGQSEKLRKVVLGMGLRKIGHEREYKDTNCIRGMLNKVKHLVTYRLVD